jgi:hypothetical protein
MSTGKSKAELIKNAGEINRIHTQIVENAQSNLQLAIECGTILADVRKDAGHGNWENWLKTNCHEIAPETARLYMRLAKNAEKLEKLAAQNGNTVADLSIRGAVRLLAPEKTDEQKAGAEAERQRRATAKADAAKLAAAAGANLTDVMKAKGIDEIKNALKQSEQFDEVVASVAPPLEQQLKLAAPQNVVAALVKVWDIEKLKRLGEQIAEHLKQKVAPERATLTMRRPMVEVRP